MLIVLFQSTKGPRVLDDTLGEPRLPLLKITEFKKVGRTKTLSASNTRTHRVLA